MAEQKITAETVAKLAKLSRLEITAAESPEYVKHLEGMLQYMDVIRKANLQGIEPMTRVEDSQGVQRPDIPHQSLSPEQSFKNAPAVDQGHFSIPKVMS
jgi:aspartyl-tRNA(Asn)/glutamyl-tRNA(Gln) amidotransferase subunit C